MTLNNGYITYLAQLHRTSQLSFLRKEHLLDLHRSKLTEGKKEQINTQKETKSQSCKCLT